MAIYFVGDVQGCYHELRALLDQVAFEPVNDQLWLAGDLVARGPDSLKTLRYVKALGDSAKVVLGNHDLHLLAIHAGLKKAKPADFFDELLAAPDVNELMDWLAKQPLIQKMPNENVYMSHAGLPPFWSPEEAILQANEVNKKLASGLRKEWLAIMYGEEPTQWSLAQSPDEKFRITVNSLTRMRYCQLNQALEFSCKLSIEQAPSHIKPWFDFAQNKNDYSWIFGHWASLMGHCSAENIYALDTGCVWGGHLTLLRWSDKKLFTEHSHRENKREKKNKKTHDKAITKDEK
ncbi:MAG: symmetrical bis(5'-nucleosyl)-tetraphosphatase [Colwellia sp.]|jgi:bis(5'-nucleosyl)-tetraphosphatase (symmetrical)